MIAIRSNPAMITTLFGSPFDLSIYFASVFGKSGSNLLNAGLNFWGNNRPISHTHMAKQDQAKMIAIVSYITIIGWIVAIIMHQDAKNKFAAFHIRQTLLLYITGFILGFIPFIGWILWIGVLVLWIIGLIDCINEGTKPVPVLGGYAQEWFKGLA